MQWRRLLPAALLLVTVARAGRLEDELRPKITAIRYPPLAEMARIQGDVCLKFNSGAVTVLSGHELLAKAASESAKELGSILGAGELELTYHFVFVNTTTSVYGSRVIKRGNAFERAMLRLFGQKTETIVYGYECKEGVAPRSDFQVAGNVIEIWIYGREFCLQTASAVARR